jgi:MFS family permease
LDTRAFDQRTRDLPSQNSGLPPVMARVAVTAIFFLNGFILSSWVPRIPAVKDDLYLSEGRLGLALLGTAVGALLAMPVTGWLLPRVGSRVMTIIGVMLLAMLLVGLALAKSWVTLTLALVLFGAANGALDVSMNAHGVVVERRYQRPILTSFHADLVSADLPGRRLVACLPGWESGPCRIS